MIFAAGINQTRILLAATLISGAVCAQEAPTLHNETWIRVWDRFGLRVERNPASDQWRVLERAHKLNG
jgi:hypothetical protein